MYNPEGDMRDKTWKRDVYDSLPGFMNTFPNSNNAKILNIISRLGNLYKNDALLLSDQLNVNNASGQLLTDLARDYNVVRIDEDDEFLRFEVKFNMFKNHLGPGRNDFDTMMSRLLMVSPKDFNIHKTGVKEFIVTNIPWNFDSGANTNLKRIMVSSVVQAIAPPEYKLDYIQYNKINHSTRYRATKVKKAVTKRIKPKDENYINKILGGSK